jgi:hypothetical protein
VLTTGVCSQQEPSPPSSTPSSTIRVIEVEIVDETDNTNTLTDDNDNNDNGSFQFNYDAFKSTKIHVPCEFGACSGAATCARGRHIVSGGCMVKGAPPYPVLNDSWPDVDSNSWRCWYSPPRPKIVDGVVSSEYWQITITAICY